RRFLRTLGSGTRTNSRKSPPPGGRTTALRSQVARTPSHPSASFQHVATASGSAQSTVTQVSRIPASSGVSATIPSRAVDLTAGRWSYRDRSDDEEDVGMKYVMLIYHGAALEEQAELSDDEQKQVAA